MVAEEWSPTAMRYAVGKDGRLGRVTGHYLGSVYLRPPGGGREWSSPPEELRQPTAQELAQIRVLTTRVPVVNGGTGDLKSSPGVVAVVLSADHELRPRPEPATGCMQCAYLVEWFDHYMATGPQHDESAAVDCVVEVRNHPHDPPKMGIKEFAPQYPATREARQ
ncbi:hypothetical protein [Streptomyces sp. NPDC056480]|uniref:hypothetical protein n=1 Tax=Streptomyces sp. NPDC056480 TaxID=3345833 RepID=UPI0036C28856